MKRQNIIRNTLLIILTIYFILQICKNCSNYSFLDWIVLAWILACLYAIVIGVFKILENRGPKKKKQLRAERPKTKKAKAKPPTVQTPEEPQKSNLRPKRTEREEELADNFFIKYMDAIPVWEKGFQDLYGWALQEKDLNKRIEKLEQAADVFLKTRTFFYNKSKGGQIYFQDTWEYMHNSRSNCFSYLDTINNAIEETKWKRDVVIPNILETIRRNDGILQKDIYAKLPHISKEEIQYYLKHFEHESVVTRTKKGNSYELHIKQEKEGVMYGKTEYQEPEQRES